MAKPRVVVYLKDGANAGSSYYRVLQYVPDLANWSGETIATRILIPEALRQARLNLTGRDSAGFSSLVIRAAYAASTLRAFFFFLCDLVRQPDVVIVSRSLLPRTFVRPISSLYARLLHRAGKVIWDFDDDIIASREISLPEFSLLCEASTLIVATHNELLQLLPASSSVKATTLPTTDGDFRGTDFDATLEDRRTTFQNGFHIVWVASSSNLPNLDSVVDALDNAADAVRRSCGKTMKLEVVCNTPFNHAFQHLELINTPWTHEAAKRALLKAHLGIMPLVDSRFARGKGGFKLVQYLATGIPGVASWVGFNSEVVDDGATGYLVRPGDELGWVDAIVNIACDESLWSRMSKTSHERFHEVFSYQTNANFWLNAITGSTSKPRGTHSS